MNPPSDNPYAPPASFDADAMTRLWAVEDRMLMVRDRFELPDINLSGTKRKLVRQERVFRSPTIWKSLFGILCLFVIPIIPGIEGFSSLWWTSSACAFAVISWLLHLCTARQARVSLHGPLPVGGWTKWAGLGGMGIGDALMVLYSVTGRTEELYSAGLGIYYGGLATLFLGTYHAVNCSGYRDGWFYLTGVRGSVLSQLEKMPADATHDAGN